MTLAVLGAPPAFAAPLHVGRPNLPAIEPFLADVEDILDRAWLTNRGPVVRRFEERVAELSGVSHAVAVSNATMGLQVLGQVLGLRGEVVMPAWTFVATAHALRWIGLTPRFADVDAQTHLLDPAAVARAVHEGVSAVVGVHLWGRACDDQALRTAAARRIPVVYDAAHAVGATARDDLPIGRLGDAAVFSFHATKLVHAFEGGVVATDDQALADAVRQASNFGFTGVDQVDGLGINAKLSEIAAAMGLRMLDELPRISQVNRAHHARYARRLGELPGVRMVPSAPATRPYVVLEIDPAVAPLTRDELATVLHADGVRARRYFTPGVHRMAPYDVEQPDVGDGLPVTERLAETTLTLPTGAALTSADVTTVTDLIARAFAAAPVIRARASAPVAIPA